MIVGIVLGLLLASTRRRPREGGQGERVPTIAHVHSPFERRPSSHLWTDLFVPIMIGMSSGMGVAFVARDAGQPRRLDLVIAYTVMMLIAGLVWLWHNTRPPRPVCHQCGGLLDKHPPFDP